MADLAKEMRQLTTIADLERRLEETERLAVGVYMALLETGRRMSPNHEARLAKLRRKHGDRIPLSDLSK